MAAVRRIQIVLGAASTGAVVAACLVGYVQVTGHWEWPHWVLCVCPGGYVLRFAQGTLGEAMPTAGAGAILTNAVIYAALGLLLALPTFVWRPRAKVAAAGAVLLMILGLVLYDRDRHLQVRPGSPSFPVQSTSSSAEARFTALIPPSLDVHFTAVFSATNDSLSINSLVPCSFLRADGSDAMYAVEVPLESEFERNDEFEPESKQYETAESLFAGRKFYGVKVDLHHFLPGRCRWSLTDIYATVSGYSPGRLHVMRVSNTGPSATWPSDRPITIECARVTAAGLKFDPIRNMPESACADVMTWRRVAASGQWEENSRPVPWHVIAPEILVSFLNRDVPLPTRWMIPD